MYESYAMQTFTGKRVELDGRRFVDCTFRQCTIVYCGGLLPHFEGHACFEDSELMLEDGADRTLELLKLLHETSDRALVEDLLSGLLNGPTG